MQSNPILPLDCLHRIFHFCDTDDYINYARTSNYFYDTLLQKNPQTIFYRPLNEYFYLKALSFYAKKYAHDRNALPFFEQRYVDEIKSAEKTLNILIENERQENKAIREKLFSYFTDFIHFTKSKGIIEKIMFICTSDISIDLYRNIEWGYNWQNNSYDYMETIPLLEEDVKNITRIFKTERNLKLGNELFIDARNQAIELFLKNPHIDPNTLYIDREHFFLAVARRNYSEAIKMLLNNQKTNPNFKTTNYPGGYTALHLAMFGGYWENDIPALLIADHRTDLNIQDDTFKQTPLMCALTSDRCLHQKNIVQLFLNDPRCNLTITDKDGNTALHYAVKRPDILPLFLSQPLHRIDLNIKNNQGHTALNKIEMGTHDLVLQKQVIDLMIQQNITLLNEFSYLMKNKYQTVWNLSLLFFKTIKIFLLLRIKNYYQYYFLP